MHKIWETIINNYNYMVLRYCTNVCFTSTLEEEKQALSHLRHNNKLANSKSLLPQFGSTKLGHSEPAFSPQAELSKDERTQRSVASSQSCDTSCILDTRGVTRVWGWFHKQGCLNPAAFPALPCGPGPSATPLGRSAKEETGPGSDGDI